MAILKLRVIIGIIISFIHALSVLRIFQKKLAIVLFQVKIINIVILIIHITK